MQEDPQWRKRSGAGLPDGPAVLARRVSVQPEEASTLQELDIDDLESHRSDDPRGMRRHKTAHSTVQIGRRKEDVEEGADRWGRPHVASLSFHSLLNLRRCLETGVVLLDLEEKDLPGLAYRVVEQMVVEELILPEDRPVVMRALLLRHRHVHDHDRGFRFGGKRNYSSYTSLQVTVIAAVCPSFCCYIYLSVVRTHDTRAVNVNTYTGNVFVSLCAREGRGWFPENVR